MSLFVQAVQMLFGLLQIAILLDVLFSWVRPDPYNPFVRLVAQIAGIVLNPLRRVVPPFSGLDITPIIAMILLQIIESIIVQVLRG
ncbi:MAG: YggT family protein [Chloroflexi bacterium]|nr:YggT family protein [Chloroflexota bacterium]